MPNRYTRDELINIALNMAQLPNLMIHDIPNGVVQQDAYSIQWLQDILDFWYHMVPFSATVQPDVQLNCVAQQSYVVLPSDFILDVRNGYLVQTVPGDNTSFKRTLRLPLQKFINRKISNQASTNVNYPTMYSIIDVDAFGNQLMQVTPTPTIATVGKLYYYALPPVLQAGDKPAFPNDYVCTEYIRIRALEWNRVYDPGTAQKFCEKIIAGMKSAGLMNEPEDDEIPFDTAVYNKQYGGSVYASYAWLGPQ
jgi:hypothetical protein